MGWPARLTVLLSLTISGCASMCDSSYDFDFHVFGGARERLNRSHGRVGSVFDPAEVVAAAPTATPYQALPVDDRALEPEGDEDLDAETGDSSEDAQKLRERLLDKLDEIDDLPAIPSPDPGTGGDSV